MPLPDLPGVRPGTPTVPEVRLGPPDVGRRVVVRRRVAPSSYTDVLGDLVSWAGGVLVVRSRRGGAVVDVRIEEADVVAAKPVPPPPARRSERRRD